MAAYGILTLLRLQYTLVIWPFTHEIRAKVQDALPSGPVHQSSIEGELPVKPPRETSILAINPYFPLNEGVSLAHCHI